MLLRKNQNLVGPLYIIQNKYKNSKELTSSPCLSYPRYTLPHLQKKKYLTKWETDFKPNVDPTPSPQTHKEILLEIVNILSFQLKDYDYC